MYLVDVNISDIYLLAHVRTSTSKRFLPSFNLQKLNKKQNPSKQYTLEDTYKMVREDYKWIPTVLLRSKFRIKLKKSIINLYTYSERTPSLRAQLLSSHLSNYWMTWNGNGPTHFSMTFPISTSNYMLQSQPAHAVSTVKASSCAMSFYYWLVQHFYILQIIPIIFSQPDNTSWVIFNSRKWKYSSHFEKL